MKTEFKDILKKLRKEKGFTQSHIANIMEIHRSTYSYYESGKCTPSYNALIKLSGLFNVSTDYLLGNVSNVEQTIFDYCEQLSDAERIWLANKIVQL
ncbi:MAG: helix-turn-helix domain-containing protein [Oscillospiraceae bacterium]|jgi:transcriptional regulator with XRE-family HTH domain|nr:helix-turn-helix domain-containing protein [Oscillospiraceae bacterium]